MGKNSGGLFTTGHHYFTSADCFDDVELRKHSNGSIRFGAFARDHDDHAGRCQVDGFAIEVFADLQQLRAVLWSAGDLNHQQFPHHRVIAGVLVAVNDIDELVHLFDDLLKTIGVADDANGHARKASITTLRNDQAIDVKAASCEHLADAHQHAGAIVDEHGKGVNHLLCRGSDRGVSCDNVVHEKRVGKNSEDQFREDHVEPVGFAILYFGGSTSMSSNAAPAGIIGKTLSVLMHSA